MVGRGSFLFSGAIFSGANCQASGRILLIYTASSLVHFLLENLLIKSGSMVPKQLPNMSNNSTKGREFHQRDHYNLLWWTTVTYEAALRQAKELPNYQVTLVLRPDKTVCSTMSKNMQNHNVSSTQMKRFLPLSNPSWMRFLDFSYKQDLIHAT